MEQDYRGLELEACRQIGGEKPRLQPGLAIEEGSSARGCCECSPVASGQQAHKKAPGKNGSQGGKGRHPFPGAIGLSAGFGGPCVVFLPSLRRATVLTLYEACRRRPCQQACRPVVRRSEPSSSAQMRDRPRGSRWVVLSVSHRPGTRVAPRRHSRGGENMEIAPMGQGRFRRQKSHNIPGFLSATSDSTPPRLNRF